MAAELWEQIGAPGERLRLARGYVIDTGRVSIGGIVQAATFIDATLIGVKRGTPCICLVQNHDDSTSKVWLLGTLGGPAPAPVTPREGTVATAPAGSDTITVSTAEAGTVEATFLASYVPAVGDRVRLIWQNSAATVLGKVGVTPTPPPPPAREPVPLPTPAPPPPKSTGTVNAAASSSGTFSSGTGSWNSYYGSDVYQGNSSGSGLNRGAWFYGNAAAGAKGKTAKRVRVRLPGRKRVGNYNGSVSIVFQLHTAKSKPGRTTNVALTGSTHTVSLPAGYGGGWVDLPVGFGAQLAAGRGLAIVGGDYAGFTGVGNNKSSGQIRIDWED